MNSSENPIPYPQQSVGWNFLYKVVLIAVNLFPLSFEECDVLWFAPLLLYQEPRSNERRSIIAHRCLVINLPSNEQHWTETNHHVREQEVGNVPVSVKEHRVTANKGHDGVANESVPSTQ